MGCSRHVSKDAKVWIQPDTNALAFVNIWRFFVILHRKFKKCSTQFFIVVSIINFLKIISRQSKQNYKTWFLRIHMRICSLHYINVHYIARSAVLNYSAENSPAKETSSPNHDLNTIVPLQDLCNILSKVFPDFSVAWNVRSLALISLY